MNLWKNYKTKKRRKLIYEFKSSYIHKCDSRICKVVSTNNYLSLLGLNCLWVYDFIIVFLVSKKIWNSLWRHWWHQILLKYWKTKENLSEFAFNLSLIRTRMNLQISFSISFWVIWKSHTYSPSTESSFMSSSTNLVECMIILTNFPSFTHKQDNFVVRIFGQT